MEALFCIACHNKHYSEFKLWAPLTLHYYYYYYYKPLHAKRSLLSLITLSSSFQMSSTFTFPSERDVSHSYKKMGKLYFCKYVRLTYSINLK
jgi:hypothetical protein